MRVVAKSGASTEWPWPALPVFELERAQRGVEVETLLHSTVPLRRQGQKRKLDILEVARKNDVPPEALLTQSMTSKWAKHHISTCLIVFCIVEIPEVRFKDLEACRQQDRDQTSYPSPDAILVLW